MDTSDRTAVSTFDRVAADLTHAAFPELAAAIHARSDRIIKNWRDLGLKAMPHLDRLTVEEFEDTIAIILSAAADALQSSDPRHLRGVIESGPQHGIDRFVQEESLLDLFEEVRILRAVVIVELAEEMRRPLGVDEAATFHAIFDIIIQQGVIALVESQVWALRQVYQTSRDMNEQLLVSAAHQHELIEKAEKSEAALRQSEEMRRFSQQAAGVGTWTWDNESGTVTWSAETYELFGIDPHTPLLYESWRNVVLPQDRQHADAAAQKAMRSRANLNVEYRITHPTRGERWVCSIGRIIDPADRPGYMTGISMDITERKLAYEAMAHLASIVQSTHDAIISKNLDGTIITWNRGAQELFGYSAQEMIGQSITILIPEEHSDEEPEILGRIARGKSVDPYDTVRRRKDGSLVNISLTVSPIRDASGNVVGASKVARDISERVTMQNQIRQQAEEKAGEARRKDEFLAMLSHELRNPLAAIANASQLLGLQKAEDPLQQQARAIIERQVGQLSHLVDDLLEVSRITSGRIHLHCERISLKDIIDHSVETVRPLLDQHNHACEVSLPPEAIWILGDATRLKQVMTNLLTNAAKYMEDEGQIWLTIELANNGNEPPRECVIRVRDAGIGISAELLPHVFELFTQAGQSLDRAQGGLGIGLAVVERLVKMHGGSVTVSSTVGKGSEFVVRLPVAPALAPHLTSRRTGIEQSTTRPLRVLVADDNRDMVSSVSMLLRALGHDARAAHDGLAVMPTAVDYHPDVVLLDIGLPALNGYEVAKQIRQEPTLKNTVLVALTGYGQEADRQTALKAGFDHHLVKPAGLEKLQQIFATVSDLPAR